MVFAVVEPRGDPHFHTTRWSVVLRAGDSAPDAARDALATLCRTYWYPLYAYVRRRGHGPDEAADLVQGFFAGFLEGGGVRCWVRNLNRARFGGGGGGAQAPTLKALPASDLRVMMV